jgi:hypothetical protein
LPRRRPDELLAAEAFGELVRLIRLVVVRVTVVGHETKPRRRSLQFLRHRSAFVVDYAS